MKINPSGLEHYQSYVKSVKPGEGPGAKEKARAAAAGNTDKVTISQDAADRAEAGRLASSLAAEVEDTAAPERLTALGKAVQDGTYAVPAADVADAILDRFA